MLILCSAGATRRPAVLFSAAVSPLNDQLARLANLGGEVPVEYAFGVQVSQTAGDLTGQFHPRGPTQVFVTVQKLLQVSAIDVLQKDKERETQRNKSEYYKLFIFRRISVFNFKSFL